MNITIIGLNRIGLSIGLALKKHADSFVTTGYDPNSEWVKQTARLQVFNHIAGSLRPATRDADAIILSLPFYQVHNMLINFARLIPSETLIIDTSIIKKLVLEWAHDLLPHNPFVSIYPTIHPQYLNPSSTSNLDAHADLFQDSPCFIVTSSQMSEMVSKFAYQLISIFKAKPVLIDAEEIDSSVASVELLPELLALAYLRTALHQPSYRDAQKMAGENYFQLSNLLARSGKAESLSQSFSANQKNLSRLTDDLIQELTHIKSLLDPAHVDELQQILAEVNLASSDWLQKKNLGEFEPFPTPQGAQKTSILQGLFSSSLFSRKKKSP
jgi:prephenate dehydrogenase